MHHIVTFIESKMQENGQITTQIHCEAGTREEDTVALTSCERLHGFSRGRSQGIHTAVDGHPHDSGNGLVGKDHAVRQPVPRESFQSTLKAQTFAEIPPPSASLLPSSVHQHRLRGRITFASTQQPVQTSEILKRGDRRRLSIEDRQP